jgi:7-carboxy-7-deazaguanine synthase
MINLVERYITISGEAPIPGFPVYLIRFSGCNLECTYCDTQYKNEKNLNISEDEFKKDIISTISAYPGLKVLFTGGEPLLSKKNYSLITQIALNNKKIDFFVETNGTIQLPNINISNLHYIIDWKSPSSGELDSFQSENLISLNGPYDCIKFVINETDLNWVKDKILWVKKLYPNLKIYLSPQWQQINLQTLSQFILNNRLDAAISIQMHKIIWDPEQRGV